MNPKMREGLMVLTPTGLHMTAVSVLIAREDYEISL